MSKIYNDFMYPGGKPHRPRLKEILISAGILLIVLPTIFYFSFMAEKDEKAKRLQALESVQSGARIDSIFITGDSHVAYADWVALLPSVPLRAVGVPGHPIEGTLLALPKHLHPNTKRVVIWVGVNNLLLFYRKSNEVLNSYSELLTFLKDKELEFSVMAIVPLANMPKFNEQIKEINPQLQALTMAYGGRYIDPTAELAPSGALDSTYTTDGIHLNAKGYAIVAKHIKAATTGSADPN